MKMSLCISSICFAFLTFGSTFAVLAFGWTGLNDPKLKANSEPKVVIEPLEANESVSESSSPSPMSQEMQFPISEAGFNGSLYQYNTSCCNVPLHGGLIFSPSRLTTSPCTDVILEGKADSAGTPTATVMPIDTKLLRLDLLREDGSVFLDDAEVYVGGSDDFFKNPTPLVFDAVRKSDIANYAEFPKRIAFPNTSIELESEIDGVKYNKFYTVTRFKVSEVHGQSCYAILLCMSRSKADIDVFTMNTKFTITPTNPLALAFVNLNLEQTSIESIDLTLPNADGTPSNKEYKCLLVIQK